MSVQSSGILANVLLFFIRKYVSLSPSTRLYIGVGMMAWAGLGITFTDSIGRAFGLNPKDEDREELTRALSAVRAADRPVLNEKD